MLFIDKEKAASLTGYGLIVGLIAIIALVAVESVGTNVSVLFGQTANVLDDVATSSAGSTGTASTPTPPPPPPDNTTSCPNAGDLCDDGTYFAGIGPDTSGGLSRLYTTRCDSGQIFNSGSGLCECNSPIISNPTSTSPNNRVLSPAAGTLGCGSSYMQGTLGPATISRSIITWNDGETDNNGPAVFLTDINTGRSNTASLAAETSAGSPYLAAEHCANLNENGYSDWYLPARAEFDVVISAQALGGNFGGTFLTSGGQIETRYWMSSEDSGGFPHNYKFAGATWNANPGVLAFYVRCVRR